MVHGMSTPVKAVSSDESVASRESERPANPETVFPQSVASGDPSSEGAILWTRIAPNVYDEEAPLGVEVAEDDSFRGDCRSNVVEAEAISPEHDYTVKVDLDESELTFEPDREYYYRFEYDGVTSQTGRFRTLPESETTPERVRFAVLTCQNYLNGYFGAYHHVAEEDVDFILDLGDFIYEYATQREGRTVYPDREITLPSGREKASTLDDYRYLYRTYHSDPFLRTALERHTRIFTWDDHEFANDIYWDYEQDAPRAEHPADGDPERMRQLVRDALKAWWEYTPTRAEYTPDADSVNEILDIQRKFEFGDLLTLIVTDERLFKTQPDFSCAETRIPDWVENLLPELIQFCYVNKDPSDTMLGEEQCEWFFDQIRASEAVWTVWANEVLTLPARVGIGPFSVNPSDQAWDGYESEREEIMYRIKHSGIQNFVTLTGDMHSYLVGYQRLDYPSWIQSKVTNPDPKIEQSRRVGVELMTPAITSVNIAEKFGENFANRVPETYAERFPEAFEFAKRLYSSFMVSLFSTFVQRHMPHIEAFNSENWGYSVIEFTQDDCKHWAYSVDKTENSSEAEKELINAVRIPNQEAAEEIAIQEMGDEYW